jgi:transcriptional regulator with XRE-family HTH domain
MDLKDMIAEWVKAARTSAGLSGAALGAKLELELGSSSRGHTRANISHWETGKHEPSIQQILAIVKITGMGLPEAVVSAMRAGTSGSEEKSQGNVIPVTAAHPKWMDDEAFRLLEFYYSLDKRRREDVLDDIKMLSDKAARESGGAVADNKT